MSIDLPISKSIANRLLIRQAMKGDELMPVSSSMPDDVRLLHDILESNREGRGVCDVENCGTAMRFLTAFWAQCPGSEVLLTGNERMKERPIASLVDALLSLGADIAYVEKEGYPPLRIRGRKLREARVSMPDAVSTQFVSALLLINVEVETRMDSPYISMTRYVCAHEDVHVEADWSSAAVWYEYVAIHGGELFLNGLKADSLQGDRCVADIFGSLGVATQYAEQGVRIYENGEQRVPCLTLDFKACPDLYPAVAITCQRLGVQLRASGTESLRLKESDRLDAVERLHTAHDHRMAMALMAADYPCDDPQCVSKSYPSFVQQLCSIQ